MKKNFSSITLSVLLLTCFVSCNNNNSGPETYSLKLRLLPGDHFKQEININKDLNIVKVFVNTKLAAGADFEVLSSDSTHKMLKMTFTKMDIHMVVKTSGIVTPEGSMDSLLNEVEHLIIGKQVTLRLNSSNWITDVMGIDQSFRDSLAQVAEGLEKDLFDKNRLNSMFGMWLSMHPDTSVKAGDSWDATAIVDVGGSQMDINMKYTLMSVKDSFANISFTGKMTTGGVYSGTYHLNLVNGYTSKGNYKIDEKGELVLEGEKNPHNLREEGTMKGYE